MARRRVEEDEHENHERWLVSYADFITLLFAFFVVMYAISSVNEGKYRELSQSLGKAFGGTPLAGPAQPSSREISVSASKLTAEQKRISEIALYERRVMTSMANNLLKALAPLVKDGKVKVAQTTLGVRVEINASVLFLPGEAKLSDQSQHVLKALAEVMRSDKHLIQVEGHTDNIPIANGAFASNWELSSVRASSVVRLFVDSGIEPERLTVIGHSANKPVASNEDTTERARNRRVTVMILSGRPEVVADLPITAEPNPAPVVTGNGVAKP